MKTKNQQKAIVGGPGIPGVRVKILRDGFLKAMKDPKLLGRSGKARLGTGPVSGGKLKAFAREVVTQPRRSLPE